MPVSQLCYYRSASFFATIQLGFSYPKLAVHAQVHATFGLLPGLVLETLWIDKPRNLVVDKGCSTIIIKNAAWIRV